MQIRSSFLCTSISAALLLSTASAQQLPENPTTLLRTGQDLKAALKVNDSIFMAIGFGNTFMVTTGEGNVVIDTSIVFNAARHKQLLRAENAGPVKYIILTHAHGDHTGGVSTWKEPGTQVIAHREHEEFEHYQARLGGFFARRNAAQFALQLPPVRDWTGNYAGNLKATILFDDKYQFELGGLTFDVLHTAGETYDHLTVWIPQLKAAFVGDNYYDSFPNIYTLRGTKPRWALDYVSSINKVLALKPEILLPSHGQPVRGNAEITRALTRYRDAIQYVHDETVKGMNAGKDVWALMQEIKLPPDLDIGESYGKLSWSVRGIYEGYAGWFDGSPETMYEVPARGVYPDVVRLVGGPDALAKLAREYNANKRFVEALHVTEMSLAADPKHQASLEARLAALKSLRDACRNSNERGWLDFSINEVQRKIEDR